MAGVVDSFLKVAAALRVKEASTFNALKKWPKSVFVVQFLALTAAPLQREEVAIEQTSHEDAWAVLRDKLSR